MTELVSLRAPADDRLGYWGALCGAAGVVLSGPLALLVVRYTHPQPPWSGADQFARHFSAVQLTPYAFGFLLVSGCVALISSIHAQSPLARRAAATCALAFAAVFASLVFLNYAIQTTFVPALARRYEPQNGPLLGALTMSNPESLAWSLELWGYAFLGIATWLCAGFFSGSGAARATKLLFIANGPASVLAALWTVFEPGWVATRAGLYAFALWNVLALAMLLMAASVFRARLRGHSRARGRAVRRHAKFDASHTEFAP